MYRPKFTISNKILTNIGLIEGAREVIANAPLVPSFEKQFQTDAIIRTVYHGTHIEGNDLTLDQTRKVLEGENVLAKTRDIQEVINYRNVVRILDSLTQSQTLYQVEDLQKIHFATVERLVAEDKAGKLRNSQVVIKEEGTGKVIFTPPSFVEVPYLLEDFFEWLNSTEASQTHPVLLAGIAHYVLVSIHPFVEGNGRTARAFATLVLLKRGYDVKRFFALEEHFDKDLANYYQSFFLVDRQAKNISERDLTPWLEYFTEVVSIELAKIKDKIRKISIDTRMRTQMGEQVSLSERQMRLVEFLSDQASAIMKDLQNVLPMVSEDTILRDLKDLIAKGIIKKEGSTKAAKYIIKR
jgi:Fic family protein